MHTTQKPYARIQALCLLLLVHCLLTSAYFLRLLRQSLGTHTKPTRFN